MTNNKMTVHEAVQLMKREGSRLATPVPVEGMPPMTFDCTFSSEGASANEVHPILPNCPEDLWDFWREVRSARLFIDQQYGQWGLEILDPQQAMEATDEYRQERDRDSVSGDFIIGRFLGDSDLLLIRCDRALTRSSTTFDNISAATDYGNVMVVLPLDRRSPAPHTCEWLARICSTSVVPDRGMPMMNTGRRLPCEARGKRLSFLGVKYLIRRSMDWLVCAGS
jgi:hypothetical protein